MDTRALGDTGLTVTALGFGAMQAGDPRIPEAEAERLLNGVLDLGIGLIDTARSYGLSEERIGRHLAHRRGEFLLSTKVGYGVEGCEDWSAPCIRFGVDQARDRLRTDVIDIVHLHSCPAGVLDKPGLIDALCEARDAGKIRVVSYSGDGTALERALATGRFGSVQLSFNIVDRANLGATGAKDRTVEPGVIAKRVLAGAPWRAGVPSPGAPEAEYRERFETFRSVTGLMDDWADTSIRFAAFSPGIHCVLAGTTSLAHLQANVRTVSRGPLPQDIMESLQQAYAAVGSGWESIV